jgi:hypothetical protein
MVVFSKGVQRVAAKGACSLRLLAKSVAYVSCIALLLGFSSGCELNEFVNQEKRLQPLVDRSATTNELFSLLGTNYIRYSKSDASWPALTNVLAQQATAVQTGAAKWPEVLVYSTPDMMTWVFLNEERRVVDFVVGAQ